MPPCGYYAHQVSAGAGGAAESEQRGRELARLIAGAHPDAVRQLYQAYGRLVFSIAYKIVGDRGQAEDVTQVAYTKIWQAAGRVDPDRDIRPLLFTITRRVAFDLIEGNRRRPVSALDEAVGLSEDDATDRLLTRWQVRQAVDALAPAERQIVRLQHEHGMTHTEIARHLKMPVGTVKSRSFRAHKQLVRYLRPEPEEVG
jgi:RNA polymerase sigma-70 factor (ECF subfamily)